MPFLTQAKASKQCLMTYTNVCTIDDYVESIALRMDESVINTKK